MLAAVMLVVCGATALALWYAQRGAEEQATETIQKEYRSVFNAQLEERRTRMQSLKSLCGFLAQKPRIQAALADDSSPDLIYDNALTEHQLRGVVDGTTLTGTGAVRLLRFLDRAGAIIPRPLENPAPWESGLAQNGVPHSQLLDYVTTTDGTILEVFTTPMVDGGTDELLGAIVLCFTPPPSQAGYWVAGALHQQGLSGTSLTDMQKAASEAITGPGTLAERTATVQVGGVPHLLFCRLLNPASKFAPVWQVAHYSLAESMARQQALRWKIMSAGAILLLGAYVIVHVLAARLSSPVERLAVTSEVHREGRERAEAALDLTNDELRARNTELANAMEQLKAAQQQHVQQERLRALGQMASGVAHDFNNALVPILGFSDLLLLSPETLENPERARSYLQSIQTAASDAASVVARLREFYRSSSEQVEFTPVDLPKLITQAVALTRPRWRDQAQAGGATIELKTDLEPVPLIAGEEAALREVLTNLIFNAVDAMPQGGILTVRTRVSGSGARIEVSDTGTGMSEEVRGRCLEPFFSTKGERGTGLGLSMVFGIIQRHAGKLDIQSEPGRGTTFLITLPPHLAAHVEAVAKAEVRRGLRVLVVDDEAPVRETLSATLAHDGHIVTLAKNGVEGLRQFMSADFDLVVTDRAMPGMSGDQMAASIKQIRPKTPIILLTGFGQFLEKERFPEVDVLASKPVSVTTLRESIVTAMKTV